MANRYGDGGGGVGWGSIQVDKHTKNHLIKTIRNSKHNYLFETATN